MEDDESYYYLKALPVVRKNSDFSSIYRAYMYFQCKKMENGMTAMQ